MRRNFTSQCQPVSQRRGVIASVRQRKRRDQNPVLLTIPRNGLALTFVDASHTINAAGVRLAAKMSSRKMRRVASVTGPQSNGNIGGFLQGHRRSDIIAAQTS